MFLQISTWIVYPSFTLLRCRSNFYLASAMSHIPTGNYGTKRYLIIFLFYHLACDYVIGLILRGENAVKQHNKGCSLSNCKCEIRVSLMKQRKRSSCVLIDWKLVLIFISSVTGCNKPDLPFFFAEGLRPLVPKPSRWLQLRRFLLQQSARCAGFQCRSAEPSAATPTVLFWRWNKALKWCK